MIRRGLRKFNMTVLRARRMHNTLRRVDLARPNLILDGFRRKLR